jgi:2-polyprenyl-3-methyl-5-hydroxy-6-metoxy-1,4-benzoquinol methylase
MTKTTAISTPYPYTDVRREDILKMIPADGIVLGSIGCGTAASEAELVGNGRTVHGVDVSENAIRIAASRLTTARVIDVDDRHPFAPDSLDGLILADVLEHLPAAWDALRCFTECVRIGGWVVISVPNMLYLEALYYFLWRRDWPEKDTGIFDRTHIQFMTPRRLRRWCVNAGLEVEESFCRYDPNGPRRHGVSRLLDKMTFGLLHDFCIYQIQLRCRRVR